jgi:hypothetical protein
MTEISWALTEPTDVTAIRTGIVLVARVSEPGAFVLDFNTEDDGHDSRVFVNGTDYDLGEDLMAYCALADEVLGAPLAVFGQTVRSEPYDEGELGS